MFVGICTGSLGSQEILESGHCKYTTLDLVKVICLLKNKLKLNGLQNIRNIALIMMIFLLILLFSDIKLVN